VSEGANGRPRPAVFLDRDGTIIVDAHYVARPEQVRLIAGAAAAIRRLNGAGLAVVVVTNQSGIARGMFTEAAYEAVRAEVERRLGAEGARIDATYHCPHHPSLTGPCDCRKPGLALYQRAVAELRLDARRSAFVGDRFRDVEPARHFGGLGVLVPSYETPYGDVVRAREEAVVSTTLAAAVDRVLRHAGAD
jgi:D-glycero-D-manno-heptose 1,7-bisphosphate phosphatase